MTTQLLADVPFNVYLTWPEMSQTTLKEGLVSMARLEAAIHRETNAKVTDDMLLGTALHTAFLEPKRLTERVAMWTGDARRGKEWTAFAADNADKTILTQAAFTRMVGMVNSLRRACRDMPDVREWYEKIEYVEVSARSTIAGVPVKARCDALTPSPLFDIKKVADADPGIFRRRAVDFGYHIQAWWYCTIFQRERFVLLAVEDEPPYEVVPYEVSADMIAWGGELAMGVLEQYKACLASGVWPGRADSIITLDKPAWATQSEVVF